MNTTFLKFSAGATLASIALYGGYQYDQFRKNLPLLPDVPLEMNESELIIPSLNPFSRSITIENIKNTSTYDVVIIGGGASGAGIALDATLRGLKVALFEKNDFASGTSSRSTKLIHGGIRYLEKAVMNLDISQLLLVQEALQERATLLSIAPHLSSVQPILLPIYGQYWKIPYFYSGLALYDIIALISTRHNSMTEQIGFTKFHGSEESKSIFPTLSTENLVGSLVYCDGKHDDARMNLSIVSSSAQNGADVLNYAQVVGLAKNKLGQINGVYIRDRLDENSQPIFVPSRIVVNATGPQTDAIRRMDEPNCPLMIYPAAGVHVVLPGNLCSKTHGLINPETSDGRVVFFVPWKGKTIVGTTDAVREPIDWPRPLVNEIQFILDAIDPYISKKVTLNDIESSWCGIRPLARDLSKAISGDTVKSSDISREHVLDISHSGLVTIAGGKWTIYRRMAQDVVDKIFNDNPELQEQIGHGKTPVCTTHLSLLSGGQGYAKNYPQVLAKQYNIDQELAQHLSTTYGTHSTRVLTMSATNSHSKLSPNHVYLKSEVEYACRYEFAERINDIIARRTRLAFLDVVTSRELIDTICDIMAPLKRWSPSRIKQEKALAHEYLDTFSVGLPNSPTWKNAPDS